MAARRTLHANRAAAPAAPSRTAAEDLTPAETQALALPTYAMDSIISKALEHIALREQLGYATPHFASKVGCLRSRYIALARALGTMLGTDSATTDGPCDGLVLNNSSSDEHRRC